MVWVRQIRGNLLTFIGRRIGDEIVLEGKDRDGTPIWWILSEITSDSFHWRSVVSHDSGKSWPREQEISARRSRSSIKSTWGENMLLRGEVCSGKNDYNIWLTKLESFYTQKTGLKLFPGTLNVHLLDNKIYELPPNPIRLEKECKIFGRAAFILRPDTDTGKQESHRDAILEIATDIKLRDAYDLSDGDIVEVEVPPDGIIKTR